MRLRFLVPGLLFAVAPSAIAAQQDDNPIVRQLVARLAAPARTLQDSGFTMVEGVALLGSLRARTYEDKTLRLEAGRQYIVVGVCDDDCGDMDLNASDPSGQEIASDTEDDAMPVLAIVPERSGDYTFRVQMYDCAVEPCAYFVQPFVRGGGPLGGGQPAAPSRGGLLGGAQPGNTGGARVERGRLESGDQTLRDGEYFDVYTLQGQAGQRLTVDLQAPDFDTYVFIRGPGEFAEDNDDYEGSTHRSLLDVTLPATGEYRITVTSYRASETGAYTLHIAGGGSGAGNKGANEAAVGQGDVRTERGRLESGDPTLGTGEFFDVYTMTGRAGQHVVFELQSTDFDTYLFVRGPTDFSEDNDDFEGSTQRSRLDVTLPADGEYRVTATSYRAGETGAYVLTIATGGAAGAAAVSAPGSSQAPDGSRVERGSLAEGDQTLSGGEFIDVYTVEGRRGQEIVLDLQSREFDPYLILRGPGEFSEDNDDFEGSTSRSVIRATFPADGVYRVGVTSYAAAERGAYEVQITTGTGAGGQVAQSGNLHERGSLSATDDTLRSGEYADEYTFTGSVGQPVTVDIQASGFDPYLILVSPGNEQEENDDWEGSTAHSRVEVTLREAGTYRVLVTSYARGETGNYDLAVDFGGAVATSGQRDVQRIAAGETARGALEDGDEQMESGEFRDVYVFEGQAGQQATIDMRSTVFDTYLGLTMPNGETIQNDDFEGSTQHSQVTLALPESGRYRVTATSYATGQTGAYEVSVRVAGAGQVAQNNRPGGDPGGARPAGGAPRIFGVFSGISQYGGRANDLPYTADDAVRVFSAMQRGPGMSAGDGVLLTDAQATSGNLRAAVERFAGQMGPNDLLVFFYSGHGGRQPRRGGAQASDPDDLDETLEFYDRGVTDDEFAQWLDLVTNGRVLLVLDACFSGGFAKDVISRPNRMGMFSSEEDVTSSVASKFRAGGYLAVFLADAIENKLADTDGDGAINALELSQYVHDRYREDVKSTDPGSFVRTGGPQLGYQHLVVDRGSVAPYDVIFR